MRKAIDEAINGVELHHGGPFGAIIEMDGKIIGRGHNCVVISKNPTAHAEMEAIRNACVHIGDFNLCGAVLYTTCYPCPMCLGAILWARISKVYYCVTSDEAAKIRFDDEVFYRTMNDEEKLQQLLILDDKEKEKCLNVMAHFSEKFLDRY
jgi:Cytosine/adenosine deaminases